MRFYDSLQDSLPDWAVSPALVAGGAMFYLTLVAILVYTIVSLIRVEEWPGPTRNPGSSALRTIAIADAAVYPWTQSARLQICNAETWLDAGLDPVKQRAAHKVNAERSAVANLVWAPPGTVIAYDLQEPQQPALAGNAEPVTVRHESGASAIVYSTLAAR
jgi:hypothetical protein